MNCIAIVASLAVLVGSATAQSYGYGDYGTYGGVPWVYGASLAAVVPGDIAGVTGNVLLRTQGGNTLFYQSSLFNAVQITAVHLHLTPQRGVIANGPLVLALTNTSASPLSSSGSNALFQTGARTSADLAANPQLAQARAGLVSLGVTDNTLQNIGDVDRLIAAGLIYADVHSVTRPSPQVVVRGAVVRLPSSSGRRLRAVNF